MTTASDAAAGPADDLRAGSRLGQWNSAVTSYYVLVGATALLLVLGLVMVLSSSSVDALQHHHSPYSVFFDQTKFALGGLVLLVVLSRLSVQVIRKSAWIVLAGAVAFQLAVFVPGLGYSVNGNRNWVRLPGLTAQPSEAIKLALAVWLGAVLARKLPLLGSWKHTAIPVVPVAGFALALVLGGDDLGTALVLLLIVSGCLWVAGVPLRMFGVAAAGAALGVAFLTIGHGSRMTRIGSFLNSKECDPTTECYQTMHGLWGLGSGGWGGLGLGQSREKWAYLPEAHNDFIFSILGEELGLVGTLLVLALFGLLAFAMIRMIRRHPDPFVQIATGGILCWIVGQALINIAVVIGLAPVIGLPLPLVSAGGSALIMTMAALGVVIAFARSEPGAQEALRARAGVVRRSLAVVGRARG